MYSLSNTTDINDPSPRLSRYFLLSSSSRLALLQVVKVCFEILPGYPILVDEKMSLSVSRVREIFDNLSSPDTSSKFWDHVAEDVNWTLMGSTPISGVVSLPRTPPNYC
jgi:hypothetical protein